MSGPCGAPPYEGKRCPGGTGGAVPDAWLSDTHSRSDNGPEFIATALWAWYRLLTVVPLFIEPGSPWENGYSKSFNGKFRDELLNGELFYTLREAQVIIERWRRTYNHVRPHSALGYRPPAPEACVLTEQVA